MKTLKTLFIILATCLFLKQSYTQDKYKLDCFKPINEGIYEKGKKYEILVISSIGCGYANKLLELLNTWDVPENVNITVAEFGDLGHIKERHSKYFNKFSFIHAEKTTCFSNKFTPILTLYENNKKVWRCKGYKPKKIISKLGDKIT